MNVLWYALPRFLSRGIAFLLLPVYTRVLTPAEMGTAMVVLALSGVVGLVVAPGVEGAYLRWAYRSRASAGSPEEGAGTLVILHLGLLALGTGVLVALGDRIGALVLPGIPVWPLYYLMLASVVLGSLAAPLRAGWRAQHRAAAIARLECLHASIATLTIVVALLVARLGPASLLLGDLVAGVALAPVYLRRIVTLLRQGWDQAALPAVLPLAVVGLPLTFSMWALSALDRILLNRFAGADEVGLYAAAYQIGAAVPAVAIILNKEWQPLVFDLGHEDARDFSPLQGLWSQSVSLFLLIGAAIALFGEDIARWVLGERFLASGSIIPLIVLVGVLRVPHFFAVNLALARGRTAALTLESLLSVATFTAAGLTLIPPFGARGAAWASVLAYGASCLFLLSRGWNRVRFEGRVVGYAVLSGGLIALASATPGSAAARAAGVAVLAVVALHGVAYWRFLQTLRPTRAAS